MEIWKIRRKSDGAWSKGNKMRESGWSNPWDNNGRGKTWNTITAVKAHLRNNLEYYNDIRQDIEVVQLELKEVHSVEYTDVVNSMLQAAIERQEQQSTRTNNYRIRQLRAELEALEQGAQ